MFQKHAPRDLVSIDYRMMMHAFVASWGSADPYYQCGAVLANKDIVKASACSYIVGEVMHTNRIHWDDPSVYDFVVPAELKILDCCSLDKMFDVAVYTNFIPHPNSVKIILDKGIRRVVYFPQRTYNTPKNYKKLFDKLSGTFYNVRVEAYTGKLHWVRDKLDLMEIQSPELFS